MPPRNIRQSGQNKFDGDWLLRLFVARAKSPNRIYLRPLVAQCAKLDLRSITSRRTKRISPDAATFVTICTRGEFSLKIFLRDVIGTFEDKITAKMRIDRWGNILLFNNTKSKSLIRASVSAIYQNAILNLNLNVMNCNKYCYFQGAFNIAPLLFPVVCVVRSTWHLWHSASQSFHAT